MISQYKHKLPFILALAFALLIGQLGMVQPLSVHAAIGTFIIEGDNWTYFKGSLEPPNSWNTLDFDDSHWLSGSTGIGYGDSDDATVLDDMQGSYLSIYMRRAFTVIEPASLAQLTLRVNYDDGFVAYLNGTEVARRNLGEPGEPVPHNATATTGHEAGVFETIDISDHLSDLVTGTNVLAIQVHNQWLDSSDLSMIPELHWVDNQPTINLVRYPYLQKLSTNTVTIVWTTTESGPSEVHYSTDLSYSNVVTAASTFKSVDAPAPYDEYYEHVAVLSNLGTDTTYHYAIYTQGIRLAANKQLHFRTHPSSSACTFNFAVLSDTHYNWQPTWDVRDQAIARGFDFVVSPGDLTDPGTYEALETTFFNVFQDILSNQMMWTTLGNHEYYLVGDDYYCDPYLDVFHLPEQAFFPGENERYYSFDYGNAHFVILDTNSPLWRVSSLAEDDMADWLEADLAANDSFWAIVAMHHPWYVSDTRWHYEKVYDCLVPLFEGYDVDIVFTGHDHLYERTFPIKDNALSTVEAGGVIYVTTGEAGGKAGPYSWIEPAPEWSAVRSNHTYDPSYDASYTHIYIDNGVMSLITIDDRGNVIDPVGGTDPVVIIDRSHEPGASCTSISGTVYEDTDGDGAFGAGDTPLANVQIDLSDGQSTTTVASGIYTFTHLTPGSYTVTENDPPGYLSSGDAQGANDNTITVSLQSGENFTAQDFFDYRPASISGTVYEDADGDGVFSAGDAPLANVQIDLSDGQSGVTTTIVSGIYTFTHLTPGSYTVTENDPPGYSSVTGNVISIALASGDNIVGQDFLDRLSSSSNIPNIFLPIITKEYSTN